MHHLPPALIDTEVSERSDDQLIELVSIIVVSNFAMPSRLFQFLSSVF